MLVIRFQRVGRNNDPAFRVVVTERRSKPKSGELEILGSYHPKTKETLLKDERILYWLSKGAKASPTAHNLLVSKGVIKDKKVMVKISKAEASPAESKQKEITPVVKAPVEIDKKAEVEAPADSAVSEGEKEAVSQDA